MTDLTKTIEPKSDQLNGDDLIVGPMTLKITSVKRMAGDQPVAIHYEGGEGRPYKPCKSMLRVMIAKWGSDGDKYVGRSLVVYRDEKVTWGGQEVGGIRISHMSDIDADFKFMLTLSRNKKAPYHVKALTTTPKRALEDVDYKVFAGDMDGAETMADLDVIFKRIATAGYDDAGRKRLKEAGRAASKRIREA